MFKKQAKAAVIWSSIDVLVRHGLGFAVTIVLARLLLPEDFGTIALLAIFLGLANLFADAGFSVALIQRQDVTHDDESTIFWFNLIVAIVMSLILVLISPWVADFFKVSELQDLIKIMALTVIVSAAGAIQLTLMTKNLDFKTQAKVAAIAVVISGFVAIGMALNGLGVWALAAQFAMSSLMSTLMLWKLSSWRPRAVFQVDSLRKMLGFSGYIFASQLLQVLYTHGFSVLIGKLFGVRDLGLYHRAESTQSAFSGLLSGIISRVTYPIYSKIHIDKKRLLDLARIAIRSAMLVVAPIMIGLAATSEQFIFTVFGEHWAASVPLLEVLCFVGLLYPIQEINVSLLKAQGHAKLNFKLNVIKKTFGVVFLLSGSMFGVLGVAYGALAQGVFALFINGYYSDKYLGYGTFFQLRDCFSSLFIGVLMAVLIVCLQEALNLNGFIGLAVSVIVGALSYLLMNVVFGTSAFKEAFSLIREKL